MELPHPRIMLLIILATIILSAVLSILIPFTQSRNHMNVVSGWKAVAFSTLVPTSSPQVIVTATKTPLILPTYIESTEPVQATPKPSCTHSEVYWIHHVDDWPAEFGLGRLAYTKEEALRFIQAPSIDVSSLLFFHFTMAYLNVLSGADATIVGDVVIEAGNWLSDHAFGGLISDAEVQHVIAMARVLEDYNEGGRGPGRCTDEPAVEAYQVTAIPVPVLSITPSSLLQFHMSTSTPLATVTTAAGVTSRPPTFIPKKSTATRKPPKPPTPKPTAAQATQPPPTNEPPPTQPPPTHEPPPTEPPPPPPTREPPPTAPP